MDREDNNVPTLDDYKMNRANKAAMNIFVTRFLSHVVGRNLFWKKRHSVLVRDMATVGDEAFTMLMLENHWEYWANCSIVEFRRDRLAADSSEVVVEVQKEKKKKERVNRKA